MVLGKKHFKLFNYANYWLIQLVALILIMFFQIQNIFQLILKSVLGKGDSIIGRIKLWEKVISYIRNSLIIGYGLETGVVRELKTGMNWASHAHNLILEILYQGGLVYFILFVVLIDLCGKKMMKNKGSYVVVIISAAFAGWSVHSIVEPYIAPFLMGLFIIGYYSDRIINAGAISNIYEYVTTKLREVEKGT
jgi:O-antigen ligase